MKTPSHDPRASNWHASLLRGCCLLLPALAGLACSSEPDPPQRAAGDTRQNIILITVDSLRADRTSFSGHERRTSPAIDALAASGVSFPTAYSVAGWTLPSVSSILSGRYPLEHGATRFGRSIREGLPLLAIIMKQNGYATEAIVSHVALQPKFGLARGFDAYDHSLLEQGKHHKAATAEELTKRALESISKLQEPYFLWLHYFDPHFAYLSHPEWAAFGDENIDRYDGEIGYTDKHIGRFLAALDQSGAGERSVVLFTSDHGEEFGEHQGKWHTSLNEEVARIPMIIRAPGLAPSTSELFAEQIDVLPTLLSLVNISVPDGLPGRNLLNQEPGEDTHAVFLERARPANMRQRAVRRGHYKLIEVLAIEPDTSETMINSPADALVAGTFLFDLESDPGEQTNLFDPEGEKSKFLLQLLDEHFADSSDDPGKIELDEELEDQLRALGYFEEE